MSTSDPGGIGLGPPSGLALIDAAAIERMTAALLAETQTGTGTGTVPPTFTGAPPMGPSGGTSVPGAAIPALPIPSTPGIGGVPPSAITAPPHLGVAMPSAPTPSVPSLGMPTAPNSIPATSPTGDPSLPGAVAAGVPGAVAPGVAVPPAAGTPGATTAPSAPPSPGIPGMASFPTWDLRSHGVDSAALPPLFDDPPTVPTVPSPSTATVPDTPTFGMPSTPSAAPALPMAGPSVPGAAVSGIPGVVVPGMTAPPAGIPGASIGAFPSPSFPGVAGMSSLPTWDLRSIGVDSAALPPLFADARTPAPDPTPAAPTYYFLRSTPSSTDVPATSLPGRRTFDVRDIRKDFPILQERINGKPLVWLDNAATTHKPRAVIDRLTYFYEHESSNVHRAAHTLAARSTDAYEGARSKVARFLGAAEPAEIVFVRGTTEAVNLVANTWGRRHVGAGDEIVLTTLEHHSNIVPWQFLAQSVGAVLRVVPVNDRGEVLLDEYQKLLGSRTRMVAITHVSNALGTILPVHEMTQMAHRYDAAVLVDGAQAVSHFPVNVQAIGADFYVMSGHKLFAPTGVGVLYGKKAVLDEMPPWQGGGNMIQRVTFEHSTFADPPARFEAGTATLADAVGLGAAVDYLDQIGMANVARHEHELLAHATERIGRIRGVRLIGTAAEKAGVVSFVTDSIPAEEFGKILDQDGIAVRAGHHCAQPTMDRFGLTSTVRPSFALYNTHDEICVLERAVRKALQERG
ncbi:MAG TPA: SufS family cysteine desulfurase [Candidatus Binatia bacterium]|jgi:cysteine desulfurase/selenocysteine lyase|nr:SufS family cysteine desulfurase [Candidatus Binatia bacterium]